MEIAREIINGAVLLYQQRSMPITSMAIACKVGSTNENREIKGISHFLEHMTFKGSKKRTQQQITSEIESVGGYINAFTSYDVTGFYAKVPSKYFDNAFDVISDMVQNPLFPESEIEKEKKVILEEIKMIHDDPKRFIFDKTFQSLYAGDFGLPIIGLKESVKKINRKKILEWHRTNYGLNNFIISVVGRNSLEEVKEIVKQKIFLKNPIATKKIPTKRICKNYIEKRKHLEQAHLVFAFHLPDGYSNYRYSCEIIDAVLGYGMSSWLFQEVREKRALAYQVKSNVELGRNYGYLAIYVGTHKDKIKEVEEIILRLIKKLRSIPKDDIEKAKQELIGYKQLKREDSLSTCLELVEYELVGKAHEYEKYQEKISEVNLSKIKKALAEMKGIAKISILPK